MPDKIFQGNKLNIFDGIDNTPVYVPRKKRFAFVV
jgi:hypothetical protein